MLRFYVANEDDLPRLRRDGVPAGAVLQPSLEAARRAAGGKACVLVLDADTHPELEGDGAAPALSPAHFENLSPYRPPEPVTAAGGYVLRAEEQDEALATRRLLLIRKRDAWDLPKGKQDPGEEVHACALREVREETGLGEVRPLGALGATVHGYAGKAAGDAPDAAPRYAVKTTHWFLMETPEADLTPERREGITEAAWVPWEEARTRLGYETLRRHQRQVEAQVRALLAERPAS